MEAAVDEFFILTTYTHGRIYILWRRLHLLGLMDIPLCRRCGVKEKTSAHILYECGALASLRNAYLGSFFIEPESIKSVSLGATWNFCRVPGLP